MQMQAEWTRPRARVYRSGPPRRKDTRETTTATSAAPVRTARGVKRQPPPQLQVPTPEDDDEPPRIRRRPTTKTCPAPTQVSVKIGQGTFGVCFWYIDGATQEPRVKKRMALLTTGKHGLVFRAEVLREIAVHQLLGRTASAATAGVRFSRQIQYLAEQQTIQIENLAWHPLTLSDLVERHRHDVGGRIRALPVILRHILLGLDCLHTHATCHGDLSATNVLLDVSTDGSEAFPTIGSARLTDFGSTILEPHSSCRQCCSWWFRAPELFERECDQYDLPAGVAVFDAAAAASGAYRSGSADVFGPWNDVWSVGALMAFVINGGSPFASQADPWTCRQLIQSSVAFTDAEAALTRTLREQGASAAVCQEWAALLRGMTATAITARWSVRSALAAVDRLGGTSSAPAGSDVAAWSEPMAAALPDRALQPYTDNLAVFIHILKAARWPELAPLAASIWQRWIGATETAHPGYLDTARMRLGAYGALYLAALHAEKPLAAEQRLRLGLYVPRAELISHALSICNVLRFDLVRPTVFGLLSRRARGPLPHYLQELLLYTSLHAPWIGYSPQRLFEVIQRVEGNSLVPCFPLSTLWFTLTAACVPLACATVRSTAQRLIYWLTRMVHSLPAQAHDYTACEHLVHHLAAFVSYHQQVWRDDEEEEEEEGLAGKEAGNPADARMTAPFLHTTVIEPLRLFESSFDERWKKTVSDLLLRFQAFLPTCSKKSARSTFTTKQSVVDARTSHDPNVQQAQPSRSE
jgi:hypothetical protein